MQNTRIIQITEKPSYKIHLAIEITEKKRAINE